MKEEILNVQKVGIYSILCNGVLIADFSTDCNNYQNLLLKLAHILPAVHNSFAFF